MPGDEPRASRIPIASESDVVRAVLEASRLGQEAGLSKTDTQMLATAVSELARNIVKYAAAGEIRIDPVRGHRHLGIRVEARDRGPGIADIDTAMREHFSSGGTLGLGLPGVRRMMDEFTIESAPGAGTRVVIAKWHTRPPVAPARANRNVSPRHTESPQGGAVPAEPPALDSAVRVRAFAGQRVSGDLGVVARRGNFTLLALLDALGHGADAHLVALKAEAHLLEAWTPHPPVVIRSLHEALRDTIGAAAGIAVVDAASGSIRYAGVGNIVMRILGPRSTRLASTAGTLGHQIRTPTEQHAQLTDAGVMVLHTDGIRERFELEDYPQLRYESAATIARTIVERFGKRYDDAGCVVARFAR